LVGGALSRSFSAALGRSYHQTSALPRSPKQTPEVERVVSELLRFEHRAHLIHAEGHAIRHLGRLHLVLVGANLLLIVGWVERIAEKEVGRLTTKCQRYQQQGKPISAWVRAGMDERFRRVEQIEQRVQMLLGIFASHGVLPLDFKPAYSVGDLL